MPISKEVFAPRRSLATIGGRSLRLLLESSSSGAVMPSMLDIKSSYVIVLSALNVTEAPNLSTNSLNLAVMPFRNWQVPFLLPPERIYSCQDVKRFLKYKDYTDGLPLPCLRILHAWHIGRMTYMTLK